MSALGRELECSALFGIIFRHSGTRVDIWLGAPHIIAFHFNRSDKAAFLASKTGLEFSSTAIFWTRRSFQPAVTASRKLPEMQSSQIPIAVRWSPCRARIHAAPIGFE